MTKLMKTILAASVAMVAATQAQAITYTGTRTIGSGFANLSITTDDTIGVLSTANITAFNIFISNANGSITLTQNNAQFGIAGSAFTATATQLLFDFGGFSNQYAIFQAPYVGSAQTYYCLETGGCTPQGRGESWLPNSNYGLGQSHQFFNTQQVIATVGAVAPVPEPATWGMMLLGFGLVGVATRRRRTLAAA